MLPLARRAKGMVSPSKPATHSRVASHQQSRTYTVWEYGKKREQQTCKCIATVSSMPRVCVCVFVCCCFDCTVQIDNNSSTQFNCFQCWYRQPPFCTIFGTYLFVVNTFDMYNLLKKAVAQTSVLRCGSSHNKPYVVSVAIKNGLESNRLEN